MPSLLAPLTARPTLAQAAATEYITDGADELSSALRFGTLVAGAAQTWRWRVPRAGRVRFEACVAGTARVVVLSGSGEVLADETRAWSLAAEVAAGEGEILLLRLENRERYGLSFANSVILRSGS